ncbi:MAG: sel1 repeat family protein [Myxococcales bacterium]|nr:sel1 repeat family protein [Myxococcales bacterium]
MRLMAAGLALLALLGGCRHRRSVRSRHAIGTPLAVAAPIAPFVDATCLLGYRLQGGTFCVEPHAVVLRRAELPDVWLPRRKILDVAARAMAFLGPCEGEGSDAFCVVYSDGTKVTLAAPRGLVGIRGLVLVDASTQIVSDETAVFVVRDGRVAHIEPLHAGLSADRTGVELNRWSHVTEGVHRDARGLAMAVTRHHDGDPLTSRVRLSVARDGASIRFWNGSEGPDESGASMCRVGRGFCRRAAAAVFGSLPVEAFKLVDAGCASGDRLGCLSAGRMVDRGYGGRRERALPYLERACAPLLPSETPAARDEPCTDLARFLADDRLKTWDASRAMALVQEPCEANSPAACAVLGLLRLNSAPTAADQLAARVRFESACASQVGDGSLGCYRLALLYREGRAALPRDSAKASALLLRACSDSIYDAYEPEACLARLEGQDLSAEVRRVVKDRACRSYHAEHCR